MQKTTSCSSSFQDAATQKAIPLYKQPFSDERLRGILLGGILGCIIISFMSISIATILFIIVFGIILYRFLDRFAEAVKFPKIFRHVISLYAKREYEKAVQILTVFLKQNPSNTDAWSYLIQSQIRLGRYDEAHDSLNKMSSLPYANAYEIEKLNKQIQSWKIIIERMGGADPERIEPYKSALRIQNSY